MRRRQSMTPAHRLADPHMLLHKYSVCSLTPMSACAGQRSGTLGPQWTRATSDASLRNCLWQGQQLPHPQGRTALSKERFSLQRAFARTEMRDFITSASLHMFDADGAAFCRPFVCTATGPEDRVISGLHNYRCRPQWHQMHGRNQKRVA